MTKRLFKDLLSTVPEADLERLNPWWHGLRSFIEKSVYNAPFGILVTQTDEATTDDPRIVTIPLASLLMMR